MIELSCVIPFFNESSCIDELYKRLNASINNLKIKNYELIFVNDGSTDDSFLKLRKLSKKDSSVIIVELSKNHGHQLALSAGLSVSNGNRIFILDADLQDPPELLSEMMRALDNGADIAYGKRISRKKESFFKLFSASLFYKLLSNLSEIDIPVNTGDFRLVTRQVLNVFLEMPDQHRFVRGMFAWVGFNQVAIEYNRNERFSGISKYPIRKMMLLALDAITGFSIAPLRFVYYFSSISAILALFLFGYVIWTFFTKSVVPGWTSIVGIILFYSSIQLFCIGLIGEYVGRIFLQVKNRPLFVIKKIHKKGSA
jgi:dolichol-phosphate mannosyltransferase